MATYTIGSTAVYVMLSVLSCGRRNQGRVRSGQTGRMVLLVREMTAEDVDVIIDYFHGSSAEHLELLGVDPTRLPDRARWRERYLRELQLPVPERSVALVLWESDGQPVGFSTADKIQLGVQAHMHLHVVDPLRRGDGIGISSVRQTAALYFRTLSLQRLFCEPNAFNAAPNRTLQRVGFRYVKTHRTVPGPLNYHQAVTRWVLDQAPQPQTGSILG